MQKIFVIFLSCLFLIQTRLPAQCRIAPATPACTQTEPLVTDNEILNAGTSKWFYGSSTILNSLTLNGGTLIVSGDLTVDKFYMDSGAVYIHPGAKFVIGSGIGAGLVLKGNSAIYNFGRCEIQRNLSLDNGYATAAKPNIIINATSSSIFRMANQYLVINNPYSWFVNNGTAEFWGVITDAASSPASVCLGNLSSTRMAILINKIANSYVVPDGSACLNVYQYSQFYGRLTANRGLMVCLGTGHTSDAGCIPWGCLPNNWGDASVFNNCGGCSVIITLRTGFTAFSASKQPGSNHLSWQLNDVTEGGQFYVERSSDGARFQTIAQVNAAPQTPTFRFNDNNPLTGNNFYMIRYRNNNNVEINSKIEKTFNEHSTGLTIFPMPFGEKIMVSYSAGMRPRKIMLTDILGRNIPIRHTTNESLMQIEVWATGKLVPGLYVIHLQTATSVIANTIIKQ